MGLAVDGTSSPSIGVWPVLSWRATWLGRKPSARMASCTRSNVVGLRRSVRPLSTLETELTDTFASRATSCMVAIIGISRQLHQAGQP